MKELVMSREEIEEACIRIGTSLNERLKNEERLPVFICVMKGAMNFISDLIKHIESDILVDYIKISSYEGDKTSGHITLKQDISINLDSRSVVIVEDIIDTGLSMKYLIDHIKEKYSPKQIIVATLLDKACARKIPVQIDYVGKTLNENKFVVGYGLDYKELHRNNPYIYVPTKEEVEKMDIEVAK